MTDDQEGRVMGAMTPLCSKPLEKPCRWYWAGAHFVQPGLYVWLWGKNRRVLPWPQMLWVDRLYWWLIRRGWKFHE